MIQRSLLRQNRISSSRLCCLQRRPALPSSYHHFRIASLPPAQRISSRCYSTTPEEATSDSTEPPEAPQTQTQTQTQTQSQTSSNGNDSPLSPAEAKDREIIDLKDRYLRSVADFRNLQERTKRDIQAARDFAITRFSGDLVESVDNLDRALSTVPAQTLARAADGGEFGKGLKDLYEGLKMTESILMQTLKRHGLERFDPIETGEKFDPRVHEATFQTKVEGKEDGEVFATQQKGFMLNGRVLRAAKVGVVKNT